MPLNILENGNGDTMPKVVVDNDMNTDPSEVTDEYLITKQFKSSSDFSQHIEKEAVRTKSGYIDTIVAFCEKNNMEIESVKKLLTANLKEKIAVEAADLNLLKGEKSGKLPL
tara:strand:+ start:134 stop:469 length:336 start_codon:yes stop_codon:yes gene_type:complete